MPRHIKLAQAEPLSLQTSGWALLQGRDAPNMGLYLNGLVMDVTLIGTS